MTAKLKTEPTLASRLVAVPRLTPVDRASMYRLLDRHFEGVTERRFQLDLEDKNWALLMERKEGRPEVRRDLAGFTTLRFDRAVETHEGDPIDVITSGDTIVAPDAWSSSNLAPSWIAAVRSLAESRRLFWQLIVSGWRTYRFLPVFWRRFVPRYDQDNSDTTDGSVELLRRLARARFGSAFDEAAGVVRFPQPQRLRGDLAGIPETRRRSAHVDFFARTNPGHAEGDELVCLTEICDQNLTPAGRRMVARGQAASHEAFSGIG